MAQNHLTIHGHFYQPPRENPWTESIERQASASPYHDWNERIHQECYSPNAFARILDEGNRITNIVNNFEKISFNFGPTLLSWIEKHAQPTYRRILDADKSSVNRFGGHGSAIAQAYNHAILPLCTEQDMITQIRWGLADFRHRFAREPESMWLPETAVNSTVLKALIDHGLKYVILSPGQAGQIRKFDDEKWIEVDNGELDTTRPYRWFARNQDGIARSDRFIDIFFYHKDLSHGVGFAHYARDANDFANRIDGALGNNGTDGPHLVSIATDGETYGHHEPFGERALAYLLQIEVPRRGIKLTNFGEYLEHHPPEWEVELKAGENGEGTAWSCTHGLGRWSRNCGCRGDGPAEWTQEWRGPLREALDQLRDEVNHLSIELGEPLFKDLFEARNRYIDVILERTPERIESFLNHHQRRPLTAEERIAAIKLLEMQRNAQLMYTSCGWFFTELSGIETVQIIQYAARAIQLAEALSSRPFEDRFLRNLKRARSNLAEYGDGEGVYKKLVKPAVVTFDRVVNTHAIRTLFLEVPEHDRLYHYSLHRKDVAMAESDQTTLMAGMVEAHSGVTAESASCAFALVKRGTAESVQCFVRRLDDGWDYREHRDHLVSNFTDIEDDLIEHLTRHWAGQAFGLKNMFFEERQQVIQRMLQERLDEIGQGYSQLYESYSPLINILSDLGATIPEELSVPARYTLSREFRDEIERLENVAERHAFERCLEIARQAEKLKIALDTRWASRHLQGMVKQRLRSLYVDFVADKCKELLNLVEGAQRLKLNLWTDEIQNLTFQILQDRLLPLIDSVLSNPQQTSSYDLVSNFLQISYYFGFNTKIYKDRLQAIERELSEDPQFWP